MKTVFPNMTTEEQKKQDMIHLRKYFIKRCKKVHGFEPEMAWEQAGAMIKRLLARYTRQDMEDMIVYFLDSDKAKEHPTITSALSAHSINLWKMNSHKTKFL